MVELLFLVAGAQIALSQALLIASMLGATYWSVREMRRHTAAAADDPRGEYHRGARSTSPADFLDMFDKDGRLQSGFLEELGGMVESLHADDVDTVTGILEREAARRASESPH